MMPDQLLRGLKHAKRKRLKHPRIGTVSGFLRRMADICGVDEIAAAFKLDVNKINTAIKRTAGQFSYFDEDHASPVFVKSRNGKGEVVTTGKAPKDDEDADKGLGDGILLEFDCVITTGRRDRDGDVLDPKGAMVDPKMPLLWQHMPYSPIGKMVKLLEQSEEKVTGRFQIVDTPLGREAAVLVKTGCLRISHGFAPVEYHPLKDENGKDMGGWNISKYAMMEASVVSIPSNVDAEIDQVNGKSVHPLVKAFYKGLQDAAKRKSYSLAFGPTPALLPKSAGGKGKDEDEEEKRKKEDEDEDRDEKDDDEEEREEKDDDQDDEEEEKAEDDEEDDDESDPPADEDGDGDDDAGDSDASTDGGSVRALGEIIDAVNTLSKDKALPKEAQRRLGVVAGMFEDVEENIGQSADALAKFAKARDLCGMFTTMADMTAACGGHLGRAADELARVADVPELPDSAKSEIAAAAEDAKGIMAAVGLMTTAAEDVEDQEGEEGDDAADDMKDEDGDDDSGEPDPAEAESDGDDDQDDDEEDEKADDGDEEDEDDDEEFKDDDEDDRDEKGSDDGEDDEDEENPEVDLTGEENPGVARSGDRRRLRGVLDRVLGKKLLGQRLTDDERKLVRRANRLLDD